MTPMDKLCSMQPQPVIGVTVPEVTPKSILEYVNTFDSELELRFDRDAHRNNTISDKDYRQVYKKIIDEQYDGSIDLFFEDVTRLFVEVWKEQYECT